MVQDGSVLVVQSGTVPDLGVIPVEGGHAVEWILDAEYAEATADVSPGGEWMAYTSSETGRPEIYVNQFPNVRDGHRLVSAAGGGWPRWSPDGESLYYFTDQTMMRVPVELSPEFDFGTPEALFEGPYAPWSGTGRECDVARDGRFLMLKRVETDDAGSPRLILVQNLTEELNRLVPTN